MTWVNPIPVRYEQRLFASIPGFCQKALPTSECLPRDLNSYVNRSIFMWQE